jgi:hypothetical protein
MGSINGCSMVGKESCFIEIVGELDEDATTTFVQMQFLRVSNVENVYEQFGNVSNVSNVYEQFGSVSNVDVLQLANVKTQVTTQRPHIQMSIASGFCVINDGYVWIW